MLEGIGRSRAEMEVAKAIVNPLLNHSQIPLAPELQNLA
jgi:hypothetical protein